MGNKVDLELERNVSYEEGRLLAQKNNWLFLEASAKENLNTQTALLLVAHAVRDLVMQGLYPFIPHPFNAVKFGMLMDWQQRQLIGNQRKKKKANRRMKLNDHKCCYCSR